MRLMVIVLVIFMQGAWAMTPRELAGLWVLDSVEQDGSVLKDPRWQVWLELGEDGRFWITSRQVVEKRTGTKSAPITREVKLSGAWALEPGALQLTPNRMDPEQLAWAKLNLGPDYRPKLSWEGGLKLDSGSRRLLFRRNERT